MRRSGKTTRTVDEAVQALFNHKSIVIPSNKEVEEFFKKQSPLNRLNPDQIIIDPDYAMTNMCQVELRRRILDRLQLEHRDQFVFEQVNKIISLINP